MLQRSDKQPDRVEISPEQLSDASTKADVGNTNLNSSLCIMIINMNQIIQSKVVLFHIGRKSISQLVYL